MGLFLEPAPSLRVRMDAAGYRFEGARGYGGRGDRQEGKGWMLPGENERIERAIAEGLVTPEDVQHARSIQDHIRKLGLEPKSIHEILVLQGRIEDEETTPPPAPTPVDGPLRLAEIALSSGWISFEQFRECLGIVQELQRQGFEPKPIEAILLDKRYLTADQVENLRKIIGEERRAAPSPATPSNRPRVSDLKFGEAALRLGFLTKAQLDEAMKSQSTAHEGEKLGQTTIRTGLLQPGQVQEILLRAARKCPIEIPRFEIVSKLGAGGTGAVYQAAHAGLDRPAAVKLFYPSLTRAPGFKNRFQADVRALTQAVDESIPVVIDAGEKDGLFYIVTEYVTGATLGGLIRKRGALSPEAALRLLTHVLKALAAARGRGIAHRSLSPRNLHVTVEGRVILTDWCSPLLLGRGENGAVVPTNTPISAFHYIAPEAILGKPCGEAADVYTLGAILYHMIQGRPPFESESVIELFARHAGSEPAPPRALGGLIERMMKKRPEERIGTLSALAEAIDRELHKGKTPEKTLPREAFAPRYATMRYLRRTAVPLSVKIAWSLAAVALVALSLYSFMPLLNRPTSRPKIALSAPKDEPAPEDKLAQAHIERVRKLEAMRPAETPRRIHEYIVASARQLDGTAYKQQWLDEADRWAEDVNERADKELAKLKPAVAPLIKAGRYQDAAKEIEKFPQELRELAAGAPTRAETERRKLLDQLAAKSKDKAPVIVARIRSLMAAGDFDSAWAVSSELDRTGDREWASALRIELFERQFAELSKEGNSELVRCYLDEIEILSEESPEIGLLAASRKATLIQGK